MCRLHLIRHGETDWNKEKRYQGSQDIPLNETGRMQARDIARKLKTYSLTAIYCSSMKRAMETAQIINENHGIPLFITPNLQEGCYGELEKKTMEDAHNQYISSYAQFLSLPTLEKLHYKTVPSQESGLEVLLRVLPILESIGSKHKEEDILIVTHGGVIRYLLISLANYEWEQTHIKNGQLISFKYHEGKFILVD